MSLAELLNRYYTFSFIIVILLYTILYNRAMYHKLRSRFLLLLSLVLLEVVFATVELRYAALPERNLMRSIFASGSGA